MISRLHCSRSAPGASSAAASYVRGIVRRADRLVVFLDVARLFSTDERIVLERPSEEPARHG